MARRVKTLYPGLTLPDGNTYFQVDMIVELTDAQFLMIDDAVFTSGKLQDLGAIPDDGDSGSSLPRPATGLSNSGAVGAYIPGAYVIDAPGLYQNLDVDSFDVRANDVTIRNCRMRATSSGGNILGRAVNFRPGWDAFYTLRRRSIENCEIKGAIIGGGFTSRYNWHHHSLEDGATLSRSDEPTIIEWSLFEDFTPGEGSHCDGIQLIQAPSADVIIRHNEVICDPPVGYVMPTPNPFNAAMFVGTADVPIPGDDPNPDKIGHVYIEDNLLLSRYSAYVVRIGGPNAHLTRNLIGPGTSARTYLTITTASSDNRQVDIDGAGPLLPVLDTMFVGDSSPYLTQATADSLYSGGGGGVGGVYPLSEYGLISASIAPENATSNGAPGAGVAVWHRVSVPAGAPVTGVAMYVFTAGSTPGAGVQGYAVFESDGTLVGSTPTDDTLFTSTGWRSKDLSVSIAAQSSARTVLVAFVSNLGVGPTLVGALDAKALNGGVGGVTNRRCFYATGVTAWTDIASPTSYGTNSGQTNLIGVY